MFNGGVQRVFDCRDPAAREAPIATAVTKLRRGRVGVLPDESRYLMVADAFSAAAVARIRQIRSRENEALTVLVGRHTTVDGIATRVPAWARDLMAAFWPGPLTLLLPQQPSLVWPLAGARIGVRMPLHPVALAVVRELGPTASTSVNRLGLPAATDCEEAFDQFDRDVDVYLDTGPASGSQRSTIVDASGAEPVVLREGGITSEQIATVTGATDR